MIHWSLKVSGMYDRKSWTTRMNFCLALFDVWQISANTIQICSTVGTIPDWLNCIGSDRWSISALTRPYGKSFVFSTPRKHGCSILSPVKDVCLLTECSNHQTTSMATSFSAFFVSCLHQTQHATFHDDQQSPTAKMSLSVIMISPVSRKILRPCRNFSFQTGFATDWNFDPSHMPTEIRCVSFGDLKKRSGCAHHKWRLSGWVWMFSFPLIQCFIFFLLLCVLPCFPFRSPFPILFPWMSIRPFSSPSTPFVKSTLSFSHSDVFFWCFLSWFRYSFNHEDDSFTCVLFIFHCCAADLFHHIPKTLVGLFWHWKDRIGTIFANGVLETT